MKRIKLGQRKNDEQKEKNKILREKLMKITQILLFHSVSFPHNFARSSSFSAFSFQIEAFSDDALLKKHSSKKTFTGVNYSDCKYILNFEVMF